MANNRVQVKRTSTTGRTPNTTGSYATNSQYISAGELALNMTDGILYSSDGTNLITVGSNLVNQRITNAITFDNNKQLRFRTVNTSVYAYFTQQDDDNFVFYTTNASYAPRAVFSIFANSSTSDLQFGQPVTFNGANVKFSTTTALSANGSLGSAGQVLTTNGSTVYWSSPGAATVNTAAQYSWTNTHTFSANVAFTGNGIGLTTNTAAIYLGGLADNNWKIGRNTGSTTKWRYTNNSIDVIVAASALEGYAIGLISGNSYFETGYLGTYIAANVTIGNTSSNSTINSTAFSGSANNTTYVNGKTEGNLNVNNALTSNNASFLGGTAAASYQLNSTLNANIASYLPNYTGVVNGSSYTVGTAFTANATVVNAVSYYAGSTLIGNTTGPYGKTEGALNVNNATTAYGKTEGNLNVNSALTSNNSSFLGGTAAASYQLNSTLGANIASYLPTYTGVVNGSSHTVGTSTVANATGVYTGIVNATTISTGSVNVINASGLTTTANVSIGAAGDLIIAAGAGISANGGLGSAGEVLHSNGSSIYWAADDQGVTSVATGSGLSGGPITTTGTVSVLANNGITANTTGLFVTQGTGTVVNSTGVHVNSTYIGTLSANNASFLGGTAAASYQLNSTLNANIASYLPTYTGVVNGSSITVGTAFTANATVVNAVSYYAGTTLIGNTTGPYGKTEINLNVNSALTSNNSSFLGGTAAASYQLNSTLNANIASYLPTYTGVVNGSSHTVGSSFIANATGVYHTGTVNAAIQQTGAPLTGTGGLYANTTTLIVGNNTINTTITSAGLTVNGASVVNSSVVNSAAHTISTTFIANTTGVYHTGTMNAASHTVGTSTIANSTGVYTGVVNATTISTGSVNVINASGLTTTANVSIGAAGDLIIAAGAGISANGGFGTSGQVLTSNASSIYWSTIAAGATLNANNTETGTFYFGMANTTSGTWSNAVVSTTKISFVPNTGALTVNGSISATTKSFLINHPTKSGMKLRYASLEGPENGVYIRGKINGYVIELPDYWTGLVDEDTITVQLTAIGELQSLYVVEVSDNQVFINSNEGVPYCYYTVYGERKDVDKLIVEY